MTAALSSRARDRGKDGVAAFQIESPAPPLGDVTRLFSEGPWSRREAEVIGFDPELSHLSPDLPRRKQPPQGSPKGQDGEQGPSGHHVEGR